MFLVKGSMCWCLNIRLEDGRVEIIAFIPFDHPITTFLRG